jgi:TatD DNase family protein
VAPFFPLEATLILKLTDAHIHLSDSDYAERVAEVIEEARRSGVVAMVANSMDLETSKRSLSLAKEYRGLVYAALGIHPWNVNRLASDELIQITELIIQNTVNRDIVVAIGEVGLDPQYTKRKQQKELQLKVFHEMLGLSEKLGLPVIIHSRWSGPKILGILPSYKLIGVLWHWLSSPVDIVAKIVGRGDYVSEGPPAVFSPQIQEVVKVVPIENLLTETDGPVRYKGTFNEKLTTPAFIPEVVKAIASTKGISELDVADAVLHNFTNLFKVELAGT